MTTRATPRDRGQDAILPVFEEGRYMHRLNSSAIRAACSPGSKRRRWNPLKAARNLLAAIGTVFAVAVLAVMGVMWLTG